MTALYDSNAKKKATNLSISSDLLKKVKEMKNWESKNKTSINSYNKRVAKSGTFSDEIRSF
ncbi:MAG: antitoxin CcdA [Campylobacterota bacterium]|nr:antitoxin CcdA [Campylobacterota bacterium]